MSKHIDLGTYAEQIRAEQDRPLFDDAVAAAKVGALRGAYIMIWLACAESLKRRFHEAQVRDNTAGKIVGTIDAMESEGKAVDKFLLTKAHEYGFVSGSGYTILGQVYDLRCLYGHPYEEAPSPEKVMDAASAVVNLILSQPMKLKQGFGDQLLRSLLEDRNYLDNYEPAVTALAKSIVPRLDESILPWILDKYWGTLEDIVDDSSMAVLSCRGIWFSRALLMEAGVTVFIQEEWHDRSARFPKVLAALCCITPIFIYIGELAQDLLVGSILDRAETRASALTHLEELDNEGTLSERQRKRFAEGLNGLPIGTIQASGLMTRTCYERVMSALGSSNWYNQNPAINLVMSNGSEQVNVLTAEQQVDLGRNILQAGEGAATSATAFLESLSRGVGWPIDIVRGVALESFTNERNEIRMKDRHLGSVIAAIAQLETPEQSELATEIALSIQTGTPKRWRFHDEFRLVIASLNSHSWADPIVEALEVKISDDAPEDL